MQFKIQEQSENVVAWNDHERIVSELNIANSQLKFKTGKIALLTDEVEQLMLLIKEMHKQVEKVCMEKNHDFDKLMSYVDGNISSMNRKVHKVQDLFADTLRYSNKTYYQEEIYLQMRKANAYISKIKLLE